MWLLDVNLPKKISGLLCEFGIEAHGAGEREASPTVRWWRWLNKLVLGASLRVTAFSASLPPALSNAFLNSPLC